MEATIDLPKFSAQFDIKVEKEVITYKLNEPPGEYMDAFQELITPNAGAHAGTARISVSSNIDDKEFGTGVGGMVVVSLACDQTAEKIHQAIMLAQQCSLHYSKQHLPEVRGELMKLLESKRAQGIHYNER